MSQSVEERCNTCGKDLSTSKGSTRFKCPGCGEAVINRCGNCRKSIKPWKCKGCGFEGP